MRPFVFVLALVAFVGCRERVVTVSTTESNTGSAPSARGGGPPSAPLQTYSKTDAIQVLLAAQCRCDAGDAACARASMARVAEVLGACGDEVRYEPLTECARVLREHACKRPLASAPDACRASALCLPPR